MRTSTSALEQRLARQEAALASRAEALAATARSAEAFHAALTPIAQEIGQLRGELLARTPRRELRARRRRIDGLLAQAGADDRRRIAWESERWHLQHALRQRSRRSALRLVLAAVGLLAVLAVAAVVHEGWKRSPGIGNAGVGEHPPLISCAA